MSASTSGGEFEELFAHEEWVRRLAMRLCSGGGDDVAQETWLAALRAPSEARSARAWLGGIVRHVARRARRDESARAEREKRASRDSGGGREPSVPSPESLLARAELQRRVLAAVASLDEPYRIVVLMRYYEHLRTDDIARRLDVPGSTVRNRVARAHEQLRAKLDREYGGEHAAWSALFAPTLAAMSPHKVAAGVGIAMKVYVVVIAGAAVIGAVLLWHPSRDATELAQSRELAAPVLVSSTPTIDAPSAGNAASATSERAAVPAQPAAVDNVLMWGTIHVDGDARLAAPEFAVTRADGSDAAVTLSAQDSDFAIVSEDGARRSLSLGKNASYSAFGLKPGRCTLQLTSRGIVPFDEELELPSDQEKVRHDITVKRAISLPVKFVARATGAVMSSMSDCALSVVLTRDQPARIAGVLGHSASSGALGRYREQAIFPRDASVPAGCAGVIELYTTPVMAHCVLHDEVIASRALRGNETELVFELEPSEIASKLGSLTFRCVNAANGAAVEGARVMLSFQDGGGGGGKTDANGLAHFDKLAPGMREIQMMVPKFANVSRWVRVPAGADLDVGTIELKPAARVAGRVVDAAGHGVGADLIAIPVRAFASPRAAEGRMSFNAAASGSFSSVWVESGPVRLVASSPDFAIATLDVDATSGNVEGLEIRTEKGTPVAFRLPRGASDRVDFVIADASGRPLTMKSAFPTFSPRVRLKPGTYELRYVVDADVVRTESLEMGAEPIVRELRAP